MTLNLFPDPGWTVSSAAAIGQGPYPGHRPSGSWTLAADGTLRQERRDMTDRALVIAYGSNANPAKLLGHPELFADGDVIAVRAAVIGWGAVWCNARRASDGSVVATLVPVPGRVEIHPLLALTPRQLEAVDRWEGHPVRYERVRHAGLVLIESGIPADQVDVYLGTPEVRPVLMRDGYPLLCSEVPYAEVDVMVTSGRAPAA